MDNDKSGSILLGEGRSQQFLKVFLAVGDVADSVSNRRLVAFLPNCMGALVSTHSLGRLEDAG